LVGVKSDTPRPDLGVTQEAQVNGSADAPREMNFILRSSSLEWLNKLWAQGPDDWTRVSLVALHA
jgi:hypothetical protein